MSERHETLAIRNLRLDVAQSGNDIVDEVTLTIARGEVLGLVGESGSGKTTVGLAVLGHARKGVGIHSGTVSIEGTDVLAAHGKDLRRARGRLVSYVPQDPGTALNPALRIGGQVLEVLQTHGFGADNAARKQRVQEVFSEVLLPATPSFLRRYPHQLSGGQRQRVAIARALAPQPSVLLLDEPFGAVDARIRQELREWLVTLHHDLNVTTVFVTHDQEEALEVANRIVIFSGGVLEQVGTPREVYDQPANEFVARFIGAMNVLEAKVREGVARIGELEFPASGEAEGQQVRVGFRPYAVQVSADLTRYRYHAVLQHTFFLGVLLRLELELPSGLTLRARMTKEDYAQQGLEDGRRVSFQIRQYRLLAGEAAALGPEAELQPETPPVLGDYI